MRILRGESAETRRDGALTPDQLIRARKRLKLTQTELAKALGVTLSAIWRMEQPPENKNHRPIERRTELAVKYLLATR